MTDETPILQKVAASFQQLAVAASELNVVSDQLGESISVLDASLKKLNLGVDTWVQVGGHEDNEGTYHWRDIGYSKVASKWGIALRTRDGNDNWDVYDVETWAFNDGPRALRVEAVDYLPALIEALVKQANETATKIREKIGQAKLVAKAIAQPHPAADAATKK